MRLPGTNECIFASIVESFALCSTSLCSVVGKGGDVVALVVAKLPREQHTPAETGRFHVPRVVGQSICAFTMLERWACFRFCSRSTSGTLLVFVTTKKRTALSKNTTVALCLPGVFCLVFSNAGKAPLPYLIQGPIGRGNRRHILE